MNSGPNPTESELCSRFAKQARQDGYTVYPEIENWDLVLVRGTHQIGVQAKINGNLKVLVQTSGTGPLERAVLVWRGNEAFVQIARTLGFTVIAEQIQRNSWGRLRWYSSPTKVFHRLPPFGDAKPWQKFAKPLELPPIIPDLPAGVAAPKQLTPWRVKALKLCERLRNKGYVTSKDFKELKLNQSYWLQLGRGLLKNSGKKEGRLVKYVANPEMHRYMPDQGWESTIKKMRDENIF